MGRRAQGEGTITKRGDGSYSVALSDGTDENGKRIRYQATCKTRKEAVAKLEGWKAAKREGVDLTQDNLTVATLIDSWLENCRPRLRETTLFSYEQLVRLHLKPGLGKLQVTKVTAITLDRFFAQKRAEGLGASTLAYLRRLLHAIFEQAMDYDIVSRNVVERTAAIEKSKFKAQCLTEKQAQSLVSVLPTNDYGLFALLCITMGMRPAEIRGLRWQDVELCEDGGMIHVRQQIKDARGSGGGYIIQPPKTTKGVRDIPLPNFVAGKLRDHYRHQESERAECDLVPEAPLPLEWMDLVFRGQEGRPLNERYIRRKFKEFLAAAGLDPNIRLYDMRHSYNTILGASGVPAEVRKVLMGHTTTHLVENVYSHAVPAANVKAMGKFDDLLNQE